MLRLPVPRDGCPLKVAFIRYRYNPYGGAERFTEILADSFGRRGIEVHLFARRWPREINSAICLHRIRGPAWPPLLGHAAFVYLVGRAVRKQGFDLIQSNERTLCQDIYRAGDGVHARWLELRALRQNLLQRLWVRCHPFHIYRLWLERRLFESRNIKAVIVNSEMVRQEILSRFRIPNERIHTIYNGVDLERFCPENRDSVGVELRTRCGLGTEIPVVLFVGSGFERKGLSHLIRAMVIAGGDARLWVVGKGRTGRYEKLASRLGVARRTVFWGPQKEVGQFYAAADIFVLPTLYDPFPTVVLEAMASGLPVITTAECGAAEIITHGEQGFVLKSAVDAGELALFMGRLYQKDLRWSMSQKAVERAARFPIERTIHELDALYRTLLQSHSQVDRPGTA
jgi:UDP-glucose:(heptosyl)LPS alpha-1,3-glucosyltransferase